MTIHSAAAEQTVIPAETELPERKSVVDDFAGYRSLRRRIEDLQASGHAIPFFAPRDGVSHSVIRRDGQSLISFSGYNYLGLNGHPAVTAAAKNAVDKFGTSASASVISHLLARPDAVIYDSGAHNSIITGARLSGAKTFTYQNGDWDGLDALLEKERAGFRRGLIVAEGVYSMDGQILDLPRLVEIKKKHDVLLMVDEAHSFGIVGDTGRGVCEGAGLPVESIDVYMGTLSKTLASSGGYIAGDAGLIEYMRFLCPGLVFSVGLSPADTGAAIAALDILEREPHRPRRLRERARFFRKVARENGLDICGDEESPVASLIVGDDKLAVALSHNLLEYGIEVQPIVRPAVSATTARLRFFLTANHTEEQILETVPVVARELEKLRRATAAE